MPQREITPTAREILDELRRKHDACMLTSYIKFNSKLKEGASYGQSVNEYDPGSMGTRDFKRLARELMDMEERCGVQDELLAHADRLSAGAEQLLATRSTLLRRGELDALEQAASPADPPAAGAAPMSKPANEGGTGARDTRRVGGDRNGSPCCNACRRISTTPAARATSATHNQ